MDEEAVDMLHGHLGERSRGRSEALAPAAPVAALALAVVSMIGIGPAQVLSQVVLFHGQGFRALAVAPGIGAVVAMIAIWLGRLALRAPTTPWDRSLGVAAVVVSVVALTINAAAFIAAITVSGAGGGLVSG
jgi:hypothetical protein